MDAENPTRALVRDARRERRFRLRGAARVQVGKPHGSAGKGVVGYPRDDPTVSVLSPLRFDRISKRRQDQQRDRARRGLANPDQEEPG